MGVRVVKKLILSVSIIFASFLTYAQDSQSLDLLKDKIEQHVLNELTQYADGKISVSADKIDSRLNLKPCAEDQLFVFNPYQTTMLSTSTMGIKCKEDDNHWTLYVPIKITLLKTVLVAKKPLMKGARINAEDIYQTEMDVQKLKHGYFTDRHELLGQVCKQNINIDTPITAFNIELAKLVHKGEQVSITATNGPLTIAMEGIALDNGAKGEPVRVKNITSKRVIEAQVTGRKKVKVTLS